MQAAKLDAALLAELQSDSRRAQQPRLTVFVRIDPLAGTDARSRLSALGIPVNESTTIFSAELSEQQISELSEQTWVKAIRLARVARPYGTPNP